MAPYVRPQVACFAGALVANPVSTRVVILATTLALFNGVAFDLLPSWFDPRQ